MTDELDLVSELGGAEPLRPEAYQRGRDALRAAMAGSGQPGPGRRRPGFGVRAGVGLAAAAAAVAALVLHVPETVGTVAERESAPAVRESVDPAPLMTLAGAIRMATSPVGDAWLVKKTRVHGATTLEVVYTLFTDDHAIYTGNKVRDIKRAISRKQDQMRAGDYAPLLKAAAAAANSSPADGRTRMLVAGQDPLAGLDPAAQKAAWEEGYERRRHSVTAEPKPFSPEAVDRHFDNALWAFSIQTLSAGGGDLQVRAGVLRLLSTIDAVDAENSVTGGRATLTITAGPEVFGGLGSEVLTVDAENGMPVLSVSTIPGVPEARTTYESSRVTVSRL